MINFPYTFKTQKEIDLLSEEEKKQVKVIDTEICKKTTTPEELSGLLNEALDSLVDIMKNKDFSVSTTAEDIKTTWIRKSSSFSAFLMDKVEEDWESYISKSELRKQYSIYCRKHRLMPQSDKIIKETLTTSLGVGETRKTLDEGREIVWEGIRFKGELKESVLDEITEEEVVV